MLEDMYAEKASRVLPLQEGARQGGGTERVGVGLLWRRVVRFSI